MTMRHLPPMNHTPPNPADGLLSIRDGVVVPVGSVTSQQGGQDHGQVNIVQLLTRVFRGRILLTLGLGTVCGLLGAGAGFFSQTPEFRSQGVVRVRTVMPNPLQGTAVINPLHESVVRSEAKILQGDRVIQKAIKLPEWQALGRGDDPRAQTRFADSLRVITEWDSPELIFVTFTDKDADAAFHGVRSVIAAYEDVNKLTSEREATVTNTTLDERRHRLESDIQTKTNRIDTIAAAYPTTDLEPLVSARVTELNNLNRQISELEIRLPDAEVREKEFKGENGRAVEAEEIARVDPRMAELVRDRDRFEAERNVLLKQGAGRRHPTRMQVEGVLEELERQISTRQKNWKPPRAPAPGTNGATTDAALGLTAEQMRDQVNELTKIRDRRNEEVRALSDAQRDISRLQLEIRNDQNELEQVRRRIEEFGSGRRVEDTLGRIEISLPEVPPSVPSTDRRRKMAALGLVSGGLLPVLLVGLLGLGDRRFRYSDQARISGVQAPLLGVLPEVPKDLKDADQVAAAAHCVHQIRAILQVARPGSKVFVITSATAGDGKTSLTQSLALSFAAAGERTLAIDLDLVGQGLSVRSKLRPELGVIEALEAGEIDGYVTASGIEGLWMLPIADEEAGSASALSEHQLHTLVEKARAAYDVVLIDTGPALGSLESNLIGPMADGVVIVVGRGQQETLVQRSVEHLTSLGARVLGMVFNRATPSDFHSSSTSTSFRSVRQRSAQATSVERSKQDASATVAQTVAMDIRRPRLHRKPDATGVVAVASAPAPPGENGTLTDKH